MKTTIRQIPSLALLSALFTLQFTTGARAAVDIGNVQVSTVGHFFFNDPILGINLTSDLLVDQNQSSGGGGVLPSVSANFDINNQFVLTISAPPGKKFLIQPPAGQAVHFGAEMNWQGPNVLSNGPSIYGTVVVSFSGLEGNAPNFSESRTVLSQFHGFFGFNDIQSTAFSNSLAFTSITLTATVPSTNVSRRTLDYNPASGNAFGLYYYATRTNDPGRFVSIVPADQPTDAAVLTFDDLSPGSDWAIIPSGYGNLQWNNFGVFNGSLRPSAEGYRTGMVSSNNVAFNLFGDPASISSANTFDLHSAYVTAAFVEGLQVRVQGFVGTTLTHDNTYFVNTTAPSLINFEYTGVDRVRFTASPGSQFVVDNLSVTVTANTNALGAVDVGNVQVATIGHSFFTSPPFAPPGIPNSVSDFLVDQDQSSGGGVLSSVSVNWDTNNQFVLTVSAPPGKKFLVQVPAGQSVCFDGDLRWESTRGGNSPYGLVVVNFGGLEGTPPDFSGSAAVLSHSHGYFGFAGIKSTVFTNDLAFASITFTGTVVPQHTGFGTLNFTPHNNSSFGLFYTTFQTNDPGPFISIVPIAEPAVTQLALPRPTANIALLSNGDVTVTFTGTLQSASEVNGDFNDVPGNPQGTYTIPKSSLSTQQYFRAKGN